VALDFSAENEKLVAYALGQGSAGTEFILLHILESVSARLYGDSTADYERETDEAQLEAYASALRERGCQVVTRLGYRYRIPEIVRIVTESGADLLVMGAHRHTGIKDLVYGETINRVRHEVKVPVLVVNLQ
jgi:manganese transport protein